MANCDYCGKEIDGLPFKCKFCGSSFCSKHHVPETHNCQGLHEYNKKNQERWKTVFSPSAKKHHSHQHHKKSDIKRTRKESRLLRWLNDREHYPYRFKHRKNHLFKIIFGFIVSLVAFNLFLTNIGSLNVIKLIFLRLGSLLLLACGVFLIYYGWKILKEIPNLVKRQRNWIKYLVIILVLFLLLYIYINRDTALNPILMKYNETNFSVFNPFSVNLSLSEGNSSDGGFFEGVKDTFSRDSIDVGLVEQEILILVNEERSKYGARSLIPKESLNNYAREWSDQMISQDFFEHSSLNFQYASISGENIAETPIHSNVVGCGSTHSNDAMAKCFVDGWIGSPGHHENMIDKRFSMTGIGVSCDSSKCRVTQVFSG